MHCSMLTWYALTIFLALLWAVTGRLQPGDAVPVLPKWPSSAESARYDPHHHLDTIQDDKAPKQVSIIEDRGFETLLYGRWSYVWERNGISYKISVGKFCLSDRIGRYKSRDGLSSSIATLNDVFNDVQSATASRSLVDHARSNAQELFDSMDAYLKSILGCGVGEANIGRKLLANLADKQARIAVALVKALGDGTLTVGLLCGSLLFPVTEKPGRALAVAGVVTVMWSLLKSLIDELRDAGALNAPSAAIFSVLFASLWQIYTRVRQSLNTCLDYANIDFSAIYPWVTNGLIEAGTQSFEDATESLENPEDRC